MTGPIANPPAAPDRTDPARAGGRSSTRGGTGAAVEGLAGLLGASFYSLYQSELGTRAASGSSLVGSSRRATFRAEPAEARAPIDHSRRTPTRAGTESAAEPARGDGSKKRDDAAASRADAPVRSPSHAAASGAGASGTEEAPAPGHARSGGESSQTPRSEPTPAAPAAAIAAPKATQAVAGSSALGSGLSLQGVQGLAGARSEAGGPAPAAGVADRGAAARAPGASIARPIATPQRQEPPNLIAQAVRGLAAALRQRNGAVTLRLAPESLGPLQVRLSVHDSQVTAEFRAESSQARDLLSQSTAQLRSAIEARGLTVHRIEVLGPESDAERWPGDAGGEPRDGRGGDEPAADRSASERRSGFARSESGPGDAEAFVGGSLELASDGRWIALGRLDTLA